MSKVLEKTAPERMEEGGEGRYDAVVVGAGTAGLSASLMLGRSRRRVLALDGGEPRNAPAEGVHYFFTRDGTPPDELLRIGREQLGPYPGVEVREARATGATRSGGGFEVVLEDGNIVETRRILLAAGVHDELPERPGFRELWGVGSTTAPTATVGRSATGRSPSWRRPSIWRCRRPSSATGAATSSP